MSEQAGPRYGTIDQDYGMKLATTPADEDGPVWMVNLMKYREVADYADGRESTITGQEADDLYSPLDSLAAVGAAPVFFGDVDQQLLGDGTVWDRIGVVKYPTRKSFIDMQSLPTFQESHQHKDAGMESTIVMGTQPMPQPDAPAGFAPVDWADVPHPPTAEDGPVVVVHVLRFNDTPEERPQRTPRRRTWSSTRARRPRSRSVTACGSTVGSPSRARSSATDAPGIRSDSTSSPARPRSWPWSRTRLGSKPRRITARWRLPTPTR